MARRPRRKSYREELVQAIRSLLPPQWFSRWSVPANADWTPQVLCWMLLLMSWDEAPTLTSRFENARRVLRRLQPRWTVPVSYAGFVQAARQRLGTLERALVERLRPTDEDLAAWRVHGWLLFAADGSRFECPRTTANEQTLGCAGKEKTGPQLFQTTLQHVGTGLPWDFRVGPGTDSERHHLHEMLPELPPQSLLTCDAGFISDRLVRRLAELQQNFILRVGGNIALLTDLGWEHEVSDRTVYLWTQAQRRQPPVVLRLVVVRDEIHRPIYLLTNLHDLEVLPDATAAELYRQRWGIELQYRTQKQTWNHPKLLSRTPAAARLEHVGNLLGLWVLQTLTAEALCSAGHAPRRASAAAARNAIRRVLRECLTDRIPPKGQGLLEQLASATLDSYRRRGSKQTRPWPRKKRETPAKPPKLQPATPAERLRAQQLWNATHTIL